MKFIIALVLATAGVGVQAQDINSLPECAKICVENMYAKAEELGCGSDDIKCLCTNKDFMYGIRDCSGATCSGDADSIQQGIAFGVAQCRANGVEVTAIDGSQPTGTGAGDGDGQGGATTTAAGEGDGEDSGNGSQPTGVVVVTSVLDNGSTTTFTSTPTDGAGTETGASDATATEGGEGGAGGSSPTTTTGGGNGGDGSDGDDGATTTAEEGFAQKTAVPALLGVAGLAALLI